MRRIKSLLVIVALALLATGCGIYNSAAIEIPTIREKGELNLEGAVIPAVPLIPTMPFENIMLGLRGSIAYGLTDHMAVAASFDPLRSHVQAMGGAFFSVNDKLVWELYAGGTYGGGRVFTKCNCDDNVAYAMPFVQGDVGWRNLSQVLHLDLAVSLKAGWSFNHHTMKDYSSGIYELDSYGSGMVVLSAVEMRFGWEHFKFNVKMGSHFSLFQNDYFNDIPFDFGVGMNLILPTKKLFGSM